MNILEKIKESRLPIILAEMGAYLHLIGRFSEIFIYSNAKDATDAEKSFNYENVCDDPDFFENTGLDGLLRDQSWETLINAFKNLDLRKAGELSSNKIKSFCEFIKKHRRGGGDLKGLCKILADAHGIVSGIDKALAGMGESGKQKKQYTFGATAFGYEEDITLMKKPKLKKELFERTKEILAKLMSNQDISYENYLEFISTVEKYYPETIGETRRPINEITLYDYAHTIASLMKSNLAKMIIDGWRDPLVRDFEKLSKWSILKVNTNVVGLLSKGLRVGDILGYWDEIKRTYADIKKIIEFEYPLGNEIYRDSTGIYFSCPAVNDVNALKSEIIGKLKDLNKLDFSLQIDISESSRSMVILASEREESLKRVSYPHVGDVGILEKGFRNSQKVGGGDICPVCCIKLKQEIEDRCEKCKERYQGRAENWVNNPKETIWLDEVADKNDRVALMVGQFDLRKWLSGEFVNTFVSQTFDEWKDIIVDKESNEKVSDICRRLNIEDISDLKTGFENLFNDSLLNNDWKKICNSFIGIRPKDFINDFWIPIVERDATREALNLPDNSEKAKHLIKLLFRKHPSLARIYRIWKTTQKFIKKNVFEKHLKEYNWASEPRMQRIQFEIEPNPQISRCSTCDIDIEGVRISPVCINRDNGVFLSTINLELLEKFGKNVQQITKSLNERKIKLKLETDREWKNNFKIVEAKPAEEVFQDYLPYIRIYDFPDQFMMLLPAYDALDIAGKILEEYETQFSKVSDRLPFHLGIIAFHRKTPFYVVMDAGKRLIETFKEKTKTLELKVCDDPKDVEDEKLGKSRELTLECLHYSSTQIPYSSAPFRWRISYSTGDPDQEDFWHPYIRVESSNLPKNLSFDYTGKGDYVIHVKEIKRDSKIKIEPSYFKLFYLENASARFKIDEELRPLHDIRRLEELWSLIDDKLKSKEWSMSQVHAFWNDVKMRRKYENKTVEMKRNYEDETFEKFVESALINILKISPRKDKELFDNLLQSTKDGLLDLCLSWNFQIRKIKP